DTHTVTSLGLHSSNLRRADQRDDFSLVSSVHTEVRSVHRDHAMAGMKLAHANEAKISEVRAPVRVPFSERLELRQVVTAVECDGEQPLSDHREHDGDVLEMK